VNSSSDSTAERSRSLTVGLTLAIVGAVGFAAKGVVVKLAYEHGADATTLVAYRMIFALPFFLVLAWWSSRDAKPLARKDWIAITVMGFFGGYLTSVLDFAGLQYVTASLERLIVYLTPTLVLAFEVLYFKRAFRWKQGISLAVSYLGVFMVLAPEAALEGSDVSLGALLVFGSAVTYAIYLTYSGQYVGRVGAIRLASLATSLACTLCIAHFFALKPPTALIVNSSVLWLSFINGTVCTFLPVVLTMLAISRIGASTAAQCGMAGPASTIALSWVFLGEQLTAWLLFGTAFVVFGIWMLARSVKQSAESAPPGPMPHGRRQGEAISQ
jgi:drug/metabolite transporter (DMT)-like permease